MKTDSKMDLEKRKQWYCLGPHNHYRTFPHSLHKSVQEIHYSHFMEEETNRGPNTSPKARHTLLSGIRFISSLSSFIALRQFAARRQVSQNRVRIIHLKLFILENVTRAPEATYEQLNKKNSTRGLGAMQHSLWERPTSFCAWSR